jgi:peptidoglycan/xylan/chitin deacetylase (PgdA/CDA1 family)
LGLFDAARRRTRHLLRILCFHGFSDALHGFRPKLLCQPGLFRRRLLWLRAMGIPVLALDDAMERLRADDLPDEATVVTIDDGFHSTLTFGLDIARELSMPMTVYVTSYYAQKQNPIFGLVVQYMFWRTERSEADLRGLGLPFDPHLTWSDRDGAGTALGEIIRFGENHLNEDQRLALARSLGERLEVPFDDIARSKELTLMNADEITTLVRAGVDIQLHTHRHRLPVEEEAVRREIEDNRAFLEPIAGRSLRHFCYPSGLFNSVQWPWLERLGIASATTCVAGLNGKSTPSLGLTRFLDGDNVTDVEFEAEMSGFIELTRRGGGRFKGLLADA